MVALSLPATLDVAFIEALYDGMQAVAQRYDCPVIGGNISQRADTLSVTITVAGQVPCGQSVYRSGAQVGDEIWVTGDLGGAKAGLEALSNPQAVAGLPTAAVLSPAIGGHNCACMKRSSCGSTLVCIACSISVMACRATCDTSVRRAGWAPNCKPRPFR